MGVLLVCLVVNTLSACDSGRLAGSPGDPSPQYETLSLAVGGGGTDECGSGVWCPPPPDYGCGPGVLCPDAGPLPTADAGVEVTVQNFGARGEFTSPSFLTTAPPGAALLAQNVVVDVTGEYTTARGFERLPAGIPGDYEISAWTVYQGAIIAHVAIASTLYRYVSGAWTAYPGTYLAPSPGLDANGDPITGQMKFFETQQALYFTTAAGLYRIEGVTETPTLAGVVQGLPGVATVSGAGQALSTNSATAYRYVWGRRAANGRLMLGAPSSRVTVTNRSEAFTFATTAMTRAVSGTVTVTVTSGVAANLVPGQVVSLTTTSDGTLFPLGDKILTGVGATSITYAEAFGSSGSAATPAGMSFTSVATAVDITHSVPFPEGVDASYFLQVYRADEVPLNVVPSDELYLVHEEAVADMPSGAASYTFTDGTPDALKSDALYTNTNAGGGVGTAHFAPPKAAVSAVFGGRAVYANVEQRERLALTVLAVGPGGLDVGMGISISLDASLLTGTTYTGGTSESGTTFKVFTAGTPAQNVANTVESLARVINATSGGLTYARTEPNNNSLNVGQFVIESRTVGSPALRVTARQASPFIVPALPYEVPVVSGTMERAADQTTVQTLPARPHGFIVGQTVYRDAVSTVNPDFPEGEYVVVIVIDANTFVINDPGADATASIGSYRFLSTAQPVRTDDEAAPGGFMVSDVANPDSVPATIPEIAGDRYKRILRMVQVGSALFFLKEDGLYRLLGTDPTNYTVDCVDPTIRFVAPRAAWVLNGRAYALTSQGLASWTESSNPEPAALQIEDQIRAAVEHFPDLVDQTSFAVAHESKRRAYLWLPDEEGTANAVLHVFNATEDAWTRWTKPAVDAFIHPTEDRLWIANPDEDGSGTSPAPSRERNTGTAADYQDEDGNAIEALVTWLPTVPPESNLQQQVVRVTYRFASTTPTELDVAFQTDWVNDPLWWTLDASSSTSPGTLTTVPDREHSRGNTHTLSVRHAVVGEAMRLLGFSAQARYWVRLIP